MYDKVEYKLSAIIQLSISRTFLLGFINCNRIKKGKIFELNTAFQRNTKTQKEINKLTKPPILLGQDQKDTIKMRIL
jgi:hypothetical protein